MSPERTPHTRLAAQTWESLFRAQVTVMHRLQADDIWTELTMREYDVLFSLTKGGRAGMRLRDLNAQILMSQPSLSRMVERLEGRGLVARSAAPDDARGTVVRLTEAGASLQREVGRRHVRTIEEYVGGALDDESLARLGALLDELRAAQDRIPDRRPDGSSASRIGVGPRERSVGPIPTEGRRKDRT